MAAADRVRAHGSSEAVEDYAKAIYALQARGRRARDDQRPGRAAGRDARVGVGDGQEARRARASSTTCPTAACADPDGERLALEVLRHHRLLELYLAEHLGVPWDRVHEEAEALEHVLSEDLEARIAAKLGNPTHDPHGDPIPTPTLSIHEGATRSARRPAPGDRGRFVRVSDSDPAMLRYLDERGIGIGDALEVLDRQPFDGPLTVRFGDKPYAGRRAGRRDARGAQPASRADRDARRQRPGRPMARDATPVLFRSHPQARGCFPSLSAGRPWLGCPTALRKFSRRRALATTAAPSRPWSCGLRLGSR